MANRLTEEELISDLQDFAEETEGTPTYRGMQKNGPHSASTYKDRFGSWHNALRTADIQPTHGNNPEVDKEDLLKDIQTLEEELGRPPTSHDLLELDGYSQKPYLEEFDTFIDALKEAGIEPTEKQYRFSSLETPEHLQGSKNIERLRSNGPTPGEELPSEMSITDRQHGMWKFTIRSGTGQGGRKGFGGMVDPVYYLKDQHAPEHVMRTFFETNSHTLKEGTRHGLILRIGNHSQEWADIAKEFIDDLIENAEAETRSTDAIVVVRYGDNDSGTFKHCLEQTIVNRVDTSALDSLNVSEDGSRAVWGFSDEYIDVWNVLSPGDIVLFTMDGTCTWALSIDGVTEDWGLTKQLWAKYEGNERVAGPDRLWPYLVYGTDVHSLSFSLDDLLDSIDADLIESKVHLFGGEDLSALHERYGSFEVLVRHLRKNSEDRDEGDNDNTELLDFLYEPFSGEPPLTVQEEQFDQTTHRRREEAFRTIIRKQYGRCAVCGTAREAPDGSEEVEAAHIFPKAEGGPDIPQNGLGLCKLHHWAFDSGWFTFTDDCCIQVRECPELVGYEDFKTLDGEKLEIPDEGGYPPHPKYLQAHRNLINSDN